MESFNRNHGTKAGTIGGLLFVLVGMEPGEITRTVILAATGAFVSYSVTMVIKCISRYFRRKR
jgi:hypothetical protein